jgi:CBS domain-containing protein
MKVNELMTKSPACCTADTNLGAAAEIMWKRNCGFLPVLGPQQNLVGVVTDRDMCIAMATRNQLPGQVTVQQVSSTVAHSCRPDDDLQVALRTMADKGVRRLPVLDAGGKLEGVLSVDDIILRTDSQIPGSLAPEQVLNTLRKLYESQLRQGRAKSAIA